MPQENTTPLYYESTMSSLKQLEITCNADELTTKFKLQSLDTVKNAAGVKETEAVYKKTDKKGLGKLTIEKFSEAKKDKALFTGKAFILTVSTKVLVFRNE